MAQEKPKPLGLPDGIKDKYEMVGIPAGPAILYLKNKNVSVDFREVTEAQVEDLIAKGCKEIKKKGGTSTPAATGTSLAKA